MSTKKPTTLAISKNILDTVRRSVEAALKYEAATGGKRKLGITAEVGEVLVCYELGLRLATDTLSQGFDAVDVEGNKIQIKTRRSNSAGLARDAGRVSSFSKHPFDYALLVMLDREYGLAEIWRAESSDLTPSIDRQKRRNPSLFSFKKTAKLIWPNSIKEKKEVVHKHKQSSTLRGAVMGLWHETGKPLWSQRKTLDMLIVCDDDHEKKGINSARKFREARLRKDQGYIRSWMLGCRFSWIKP